MDTHDGKEAGGGAEAFPRFWLDLLSKMSSTPFASTPPGVPDETLRKMRQAFFDAWAKHCDEFLHSEAFLDLMKRSLDSALAFKQELNEFLTKALHEQQMPARSDTDSILLVLRSFEDRVLDRLERLTQRVERLESGVPAGGGDEPREPSPKRRPKGAAR